MLHLIHNITRVWPIKIRNIVFNNWLINPTGNPYSWVEVDLMQEHMNFWIKNFYHAHGSSALWEWLEMIAPCVNILRQLARNFKYMLGSDIGTAHHPMDLSHDLPDLMASLEDHEVYVYKKGRHLDNDDLPVQDIISVGLPFSHLQAHRCLTPLVGAEPPLAADKQLQMPPLASSVTSLDDIDIGLKATGRRTALVKNEDEDEKEDDEDEDEGEDDEELGDFLRGFEDDTEVSLQLESAADVSLDMDAEDIDSHSYDSSDWGNEMLYYDSEESDLGEDDE